MNNQGKNKWWGYLHTSGSIQAKRYFEPLDIHESEQSPFVKVIVQPFYAKNREEALIIIKKTIKQCLN